MDSKPPDPTDVVRLVRENRLRDADPETLAVAEQVLDEVLVRIAADPGNGC